MDTIQIITIGLLLIKKSFFGLAKMSEKECSFKTGLGNHESSRKASNVHSAISPHKAYKQRKGDQMFQYHHKEHNYLFLFQNLIPKHWMDTQYKKMLN